VHHHFVDAELRGELADPLGRVRGCADHPARPHRLEQVLVLGRQRHLLRLLHGQLRSQLATRAQRDHRQELRPCQPLCLVSRRRHAGVDGEEGGRLRGLV
jgi:hypothetical protein